jgi:hypothetical protein
MYIYAVQSTKKKLKLFIYVNIYYKTTLTSPGFALSKMSRFSINQEPQVNQFELADNLAKAELLAAYNTWRVKVIKMMLDRFLHWPSTAAVEMYLLSEQLSFLFDGSAQGALKQKTYAAKNVHVETWHRQVFAAGTKAKTIRTKYAETSEVGVNALDQLWGEYLELLKMAFKSFIEYKCFFQD